MTASPDLNDIMGPGEEIGDVVPESPLSAMLENLEVKFKKLAKNSILIISDEHFSNCRSNGNHWRYGWPN